MRRTELCSASSRRFGCGALMRLVVAVLAAGFIFCGSGRAFEVDGFRSGMSVKEALSIARKYDPNAKVDRSAPGWAAPGWAEIVIRTDGDGESAKVWLPRFCHNRLVDLKKWYPFNWVDAAGSVSRLNEHYGKGSVSPHETELVSLPSSGILGNSLSVGIGISWQNDLERVSLLMYLLTYKEPGRGETVRETKKETILEMYALKDDGCFDNRQDKN